MPRNRPIPIFRGVAALTLASVVVALAFIARTPGPGHDPAITHIEVMHNSMLPTHVVTTAPPDTPPPTEPQLFSSIDSRLEHQLISWAYIYGRERITVHRVDGPVKLPDNAQRVGHKGTEIITFESNDLLFLTWSDEEDRSYFVVGSTPVSTLAELSSWFQTTRTAKISPAPGSNDEPAAEPAPR